jgi:hypothetical protein
VIDEVAHEERVAAGAAGEDRGEAVRQGAAREAGAQVLGDRVVVEPRDGQLLAAAAHAERVDDRGDGRLARARVGRPVGAEHEQPGGLAAAQERVEQVQRGVVGPVQVLQHEHERGGGTRCVERLEHLAQHARLRGALGAVADGLRVRCLVEQPGQLDEPGRRALGEDGQDGVAVRAADQLAERLEDRHVRLALAAVAEALANAGDHVAAATAERLVEEGVDERALAGARLAADHHAAAAAGPGDAERCAQARELRLAADGRGADARKRRGGRRLLLGGERGVLLQDAALERADRLARAEAQLAQAVRERAVGLERLDLAAAGVQREHQRAGELLAQRLGVDQAAQLGDGLERPAELHQRAGAGCLGLGAEVLQAADLGDRELRLAELAVGRAAPEREGGVVGGERFGGRERGSRAHLAFEALRVDLLGVDLEAVARAVADEQRRRGAALAVRLQEGAQVRDADGERARGHLARDVVPGGVEQRVSPDRPPRIEQQPRQDRALLRARRRRGGRRTGDLDPAQHAELHPGRSVPARRSRGDRRDRNRCAGAPPLRRLVSNP